MTPGLGTPIRSVTTEAFTVPTPEPEADGTLGWSATTVVTVEVEAGDARGLGLTYGPVACGRLVSDVLAGVVVGRDAGGVPGAWEAMVRSVRNDGRPGIASMAVAAVDIALWDLKARLLGLPLVDLLGAARDEVAVYGSGGFTSMDDDALCEQLGGWVHREGIPRVKMKVATEWGSRPGRDVERVQRARAAIGDDAELFVDANGGYTRKQAVRLGRRFAECGVTWFEEPVSSEDLVGLHEIRQLVDADVAAGEYGYRLADFARFCTAGSLDVIQADVSRCAGITEWLRVAAFADGFTLEISGHTAQSLHVHPACATRNVRHLEYFADHARVDRALFDGVLDPCGGCLRPDRGRPGHGLTLKRADADRFRVGAE